MKNCWPLANSFDPLTEIRGIALMVGVRMLSARRTSVSTVNMLAA